jgi:hypothetical protein
VDFGPSDWWPTVTASVIVLLGRWLTPQHWITFAKFPGNLGQVATPLKSESGLLVEAMGLEPTNLLTARLTLTNLTDPHPSPNGHESSAKRLLPFGSVGVVQVSELGRTLAPALVSKMRAN